MDFSFVTGFPEESKVWIYQSDKDFTEEQAKAIEAKLNSFAAQWTSHNEQTKTIGKVLFNRFVVLITDETDVIVGGCATDSSFRFLREIEKEYGINIFDRMTLLFKKGENIIPITLLQLDEKIAEGVIDEQAILFNNSVHSLGEMKTNWMIPAGKSWMANYFKKETA